MLKALNLTLGTVGIESQKGKATTIIANRRSRIARMKHDSCVKERVVAARSQSISNKTSVDLKLEPLLNSLRCLTLPNTVPESVDAAVTQRLAKRTKAISVIASFA